MKTLRFFPRGTAMVFDLDAHEAGIRRFVGRRLDRSLGQAEKDASGNHIGMTGGWPPHEKPQEVQARAEYVSACKDGDLWAADEETAQFCGVPFDPKFGGEHDPV